MRKMVFISIILMFSLASYGQKNIMDEPNDSQKLFVKHINLLTKQQKIWEIRNDSYDSSNANFVAGFDGILSNLGLDENNLKSLDLLEKFNQNPPFPESTILYSRNMLNNYSTSGVLINPKYILAAGYEFVSATQSPEKIKFVSLNSIKNVDDQYYSYATDIYFFSPNSQDWENDMALITLDRPLGATMGYMGFGYYTGTSFFTDNTFYITQLEWTEKGFELQKYAASPDLIYENSLKFKPYVELTSGSPFYRDNGIIYGILTHQYYSWVGTDTTFYNGVTRITEQKFNTIKSIMASGIPTEPDIMPLKVTVLPKKISVLQSLDQLVYYLHNNSTGSYNGSLTIDIYLSDDTNINKSDQKLMTYTTNVSMPALKTYRMVPSTKPSIPVSVRPGKYYIGAIVNINDYNLNNNATVGIDCDTISIENIFANSYISGHINTTGQSSADGYCLLFEHEDDNIGRLYDIVEVDKNLNFEFKNILLGKYIIVYVSTGNDNPYTLPTYYNQTPYWNNATVLELGLSDTLRNINIDRIELPPLNGNKIISGTLSQISNKAAYQVNDNFFNDISIIIGTHENQSVLGFCKPDSTGYYQFKNLTEGTFDVLIDKPGYTLKKKHTVTILNDAENITDLNFTFYPDSTVEAMSTTSVPRNLTVNNNFSIYPNPVSDIITICMNPMDNRSKTVEIIDIVGKRYATATLINSNKTSVNVKDLPAGIYYIKLISSDNTNSKIFIKK